MMLAVKRNIKYTGKVPNSSNEHSEEGSFVGSKSLRSRSLVAFCSGTGMLFHHDNGQ